MNTPYIKLGVVFALSFGTAWCLPMEEAFKGIASLPAVAALIGALYQIFRDESAHARELQLQKQSHVFSLGATSHMANVAFDKHVQFCEAYLQEVDEVVRLLFIKGPTLEVSKHIANFGDLQRKYSAWIPKEMALELAPFVDTLQEIAAKTYLVNALQNADEPSRVKAVQEMFDAFKLALRLGQPGGGDGKMAREEVKEKVRAILGVQQLTRIRQELIKQAAAALEIRQ